MTLRVGTRLGSYEILAPLGSGGMGEVYRARDRKLDRDVAIKVLPQSVASDPEALARFEREAKAVASLSHANILAIFDFGTHEGVAYAVTELLEGQTLRGWLDAGPIPPMQAVDYALQVARGLSAAHQKGVVHRDLKPENLFVTREGQVKILDFGLAKKVGVIAPGEETSAPTLSGHTEPGTVMGTVGYMSPEQVRGLPVDHRSDLFSLGAILYELLSGTRAFRKDTVGDTLAAILKEEPGDFGGKRLSRRLESVIRKLLEKDPAKRHASADEVRAELHAVEASLAPTRLGALSRGARVAIAAGLVVVLAAAGWLWRRSSRERWAREVATPEIARLVDEKDYTKAASLARQARAVLREDATLERLWMKATEETSIESVPPGADVAIRPYTGDPNRWESLGRTPLKNVRIAKSWFVLRISKPGYSPMSLIGVSGMEGTVGLPPSGSVPPEMVPVAGDESEVGYPLGDAPSVKLEGFFVDRYEVTNEDYKKFVDAGGYQKRELWKPPFLKNGRAIPWEEAIASFRDSTGRAGPATWEVGSFPKGQEKHPVAGVSWYEAAAYAEFVGKSLPTIYHWNLAAETGATSQIVPGSNFHGASTQPVGGAGTLSGFGTSDMAGNVKEWCLNESRDGKRFILGGGFGEPTYLFSQADLRSPWDRGPNFGFRCVKLAGPPPPESTARRDPLFRDYSKEKPVSDEIFRAYRGLYAYDKGELDAKREGTQTTDDWTEETVSFNAAYGGERVIAHLFLPKGIRPPFQTVVYFPGGNAYVTDTFDRSTFEEVWDFLLRSGRAVVFPIYRGMFERSDGLRVGGKPPGKWRDRIIMTSKDLGRTLDYLETRKDIDRSRLAYLGLSAGGCLAPVLLAVETRFQAAILSSGGFWFRFPLPEVDWVNFAPRVKTPVLMLNGRFDSSFPVETSQLPMFQSLGTPAKDKKHLVYDTGHANLPHKEEVRETLDWLDKYLGPVKR